MQGRAEQAGADVLPEAQRRLKRDETPASTQDHPGRRGFRLQRQGEGERAAMLRMPIVVIGMPMVMIGMRDLRHRVHGGYVWT